MKSLCGQRAVDVPISITGSLGFPRLFSLQSRARGACCAANALGGSARFDSLGKVNATVNRIRRLKHRLSVVAGGSEDGVHDLAAEAAAVAAKLKAVEAVLVDVHRESDRDVLRNPAGLNDTLLALISTVSVSDTAPTKPAVAVSREIMARVDAEIDKLEQLAATEVTAVNRLALVREVEAASGG